MAAAHLVHGYLGAGKTTFATRLAAELGAVRFSLDEWYLRLYTDGRPTERLDDALLGRLTGRLDELWPQLLGRGVGVVLDFGFWSRADRDRARALARGAGAAARLWWVRCDDDVARERVVHRTGAGSFRLDDAAFDALRVKFEPLGPDEPHEVVDTTRAG